MVVAYTARYNSFSVTASVVSAVVVVVASVVSAGVGEGVGSSVSVVSEDDSDVPAVSEYPLFLSRRVWRLL